jgi:hypothetical protein
MKEIIKSACIVSTLSLTTINAQADPQSHLPSAQQEQAKEAAAEKNEKADKEVAKKVAKMAPKKEVAKKAAKKVAKKVAKEVAKEVAKKAPKKAPKKVAKKAPKKEVAKEAAKEESAKKKVAKKEAQEELKKRTMELVELQKRARQIAPGREKEALQVLLKKTEDQVRQSRQRVLDNSRTQNVPDGGSTALLLGLGVAGLVASKRKSSAKSK